MAWIWVWYLTLHKYPAPNILLDSLVGGRQKDSHEIFQYILRMKYQYHLPFHPTMYLSFSCLCNSSNIKRYLKHSLSMEIFHKRIHILLDFHIITLSNGLDIQTHIRWGNLLSIIVEKIYVHIKEMNSSELKDVSLLC